MSNGYWYVFKPDFPYWRHSVLQWHCQKLRMWSTRRSDDRWTDLRKLQKDMMICRQEGNTGCTTVQFTKFREKPLEWINIKCRSHKKRWQIWNSFIIIFAGYIVSTRKCNETRYNRIAGCNFKAGYIARTFSGDRIEVGRAENYEEWSWTIIQYFRDTGKKGLLWRMYFIVRQIYWI